MSSGLLRYLPFSQTYPTMDRPCLALGSCFTAASFTRGLRPRASAGGSTGVLTVRGTPGQLHQIDRGIQIPIQTRPHCSQ